ncbi:alpha/beta hydrolase [Ornithinicoccus hortensis]|uniref:Alpha/beta hydrolase family protein n=1 Tax=Ornithinicoccus hortensis TaxID=82346 RepID=A0A542YWA3_9MICO|nr:alpha/beta hydrolase family protein [Ornithinicoccus hortensis]
MNGREGDTVRTRNQRRGVRRPGGRGVLGRLAATGAIATLLLLAGCSGGAPESAAPGDRGGSGDGGSSSSGGDQGDGGGSTGGSTDEGTATTEDGGGSTAAVPAGLENFYEQDLAWEDCGSNQCALLEVPINYEEPEGDTIQIELLKVPASGERQGSLVLNPGGPGASGVEYAEMAGAVVDGSVSDVYDLVGFDPRGVGGSAPIRCLEDSEMDEFLGFDPTPDDEEEEKEAAALGEKFATACGEKVGDLLGHVSTVEVARDMDVLRAALGEDQLDYLGASYGTYLGATYAELFPENVGRFVLDGAVDPTLPGYQQGMGQAEGFERATRSYVEDCVDGGDCPLGNDVDSAMAAIPAFLEELDSNPIPLDGDPAGELTEGWGMYGIIVAMYDQAGWPLLTNALRDAQDGDATMLMFLASIYAGRSSDGTYSDNSQQAFYAVNCLESTEEEELSEEEMRQMYEDVSPTWGAHLFTMDKDVCETWPVDAQTTLTEFDAAGAAPIVVIGTTRDPATPYEWAEGLADTLESGVLVSYDGDGHTAYGRSNSCVDDAVNAYLIDGTVPEDGLSC